MNNNLEILYEDNHLIVVRKPANILSQEDETMDLDMMSIIKRYLKEKYNKKGNVYLGLVHRLDRPVEGVMVFAKTSKCASRLSEQVRTHQFEKKYYAVVMNNPPVEGTFQDYLWKDEKKNLVVVSPKGKYSELRYVLEKKVSSYSLVSIWLKTGRSHQIRVQFSSRGYPLFGDQRYNKEAKVGEQIALFAYSLSFYHPVTKEKLTFELNLPTRYPWNLFV